MTLAGHMMERPLLLTHLLERAADLSPDRPIVTRRADGSLHRQGWGETLERVRRLAGALTELGVGPGDRVATLAWNGHRHLELYFAVPAVGAVLHTLNVRLSAAQLEAIVLQAGDVALFADPSEAATADRLAGALGGVPRVAVDGPAPDGWTAWDALLAGAEPRDGFPDLPEHTAAALCYTSGTTGRPRGVLYSHRALSLHTLAICLPDAFGLGEPDVILPAVPMFHANGWGLPFAAALCGCGLVLPGPRPGPGNLTTLMAEEGVTFAAGVPTVWLGVLDELRHRPRDLPRLRRIHSGGAPTPGSLVREFRDLHDVEIVTGWGMTELSPVGMVCHPPHDRLDADEAELLEIRTSQGRPLPFVERRVVDAEGRPVPRDGTTPGELEVRGPWVASAYFDGGGRAPDREDPGEGPVGEEDAFRDGWLRTGDVATLDAAGYVRLVDRIGDLIRSGGEWISSVQLENALMDHPEVAEAAVVAVPDPRWQERPLACVVVTTPDDPPGADELLAPLRERYPSWWLPDRIEFLEVLPRTATGKFDKRALRARFRETGSER